MVSPDCSGNDSSVFRRRCRDNENAVFAQNFSGSSTFVMGKGVGSGLSCRSFYDSRESVSSDFGAGRWLASSTSRLRGERKQGAYSNRRNCGVVGQRVVSALQRQIDRRLRPCAATHLASSQRVPCF